MAQSLCPSPDHLNISPRRPAARKQEKRGAEKDALIMIEYTGGQGQDADRSREGPEKGHARSLEMQVEGLGRNQS